MRRFCLLLIFSVLCTLATAQQPNATPSPSPDERLAESAPVVTHHQITLAGKLLKYTATAGRLILKPESGPAQAAIFFTAYTLDGADENAPVDNSSASAIVDTGDRLRIFEMRVHPRLRIDEPRINDPAGAPGISRIVQ